MGHTDTRMVERVYGRLPVDDLERRLATAIGQPDFSAGATTDFRAGATDAAKTTVLTGPSAQQSDPRNAKTPQKAGYSGAQRQNRTADTRIFKNFGGGGFCEEVP
jgi:hypothetical protein